MLSLMKTDLTLVFTYFYNKSLENLSQNSFTVSIKRLVLPVTRVVYNTNKLYYNNQYQYPGTKVLQ